MDIVLIVIGSFLGAYLIVHVTDDIFYRVCDERLKDTRHSKGNTFEEQAKRWLDMWDGN